MDTVKTNTSKLEAVFDYDVPGPVNGYPYACIAQQGAVEDTLDTANHKSLYTFIIRVVDVANDKTQTEAKMRSLADAILAELRKREHETFGGVADRVFPFKTTWRWSSGSDNIPHRICEIEITIQQSHAID